MVFSLRIHDCDRTAAAAKDYDCVSSMSHFTGLWRAHIAAEAETDETMIWADKAALGLAGLIAFSAAALFGVLMIGTHMEGALSMGADAAQYTGYVLLGLVVPLWLLLRLIHFLQQGRHRRTRRPQTASPRQRGDHASNLKPRR